MKEKPSRIRKVYPIESPCKKTLYNSLIDAKESIAYLEENKFVKNLSAYKCSECGITDWANKPITLQVHHIDGNCTNNMPDNLKLICPNCHSQTPTFGSRNTGNGRGARSLSYGF